MKYPEQIQREIEQAAYYLWEYSGRPHDNSWSYWFEAEKIVLNRLTDSELQACQPPIKCPPIEFANGVCYCPNIPARCNSDSLQPTPSVVG
jgi:hypothetical protein